MQATQSLSSFKGTINFNITITPSLLADSDNRLEKDSSSVMSECHSDFPFAIPPDFFCVSDRFSEGNIRERLATELSQATSKTDYCRALYRLQHIGCININQYASDAQRALVLNRFQSRFNLSADDFCRARMNK